MSSTNDGLINVYPIHTDAFGFKSDWFNEYVPTLIQPAYLLMVLFLVVGVGIMALKQFENSNLENKLWNIAVIIVIIAIWPTLVLSLKNLVDSFNTFLVTKVFQIPWNGFGFPEFNFSNIIGWSADGLARLLPNLSYWLIYAFYMVFFFFYAVLGPLVLARGVLFDEIDTFLELVKELTVILLWQTTIVILVAFIMPEIVSGKDFPDDDANYYFLSLILGIMLLFVPSLTRKFAVHLGSTFAPAGLRWRGAMIGMAALSRVGTAGKLAIGATPSHHAPFRTGLHKFLFYDEFRHRYELQKSREDLLEENRRIEHQIDQYEDELSNEHIRREIGSGHAANHHYQNKDLLNLSKRAQFEINENSSRQRGL